MTKTEKLQVLVDKTYYRRYGGKVFYSKVCLETGISNWGPVTKIITHPPGWYIEYSPYVSGKLTRRYLASNFKSAISHLNRLKETKGKITTTEGPVIFVKGDKA